MDGMTALSYQSETNTGPRFVFDSVIDSICRMGWSELDSDEVMRVAKAYYYFSIQFRENLEIACALHPGDPKLAELYEGEAAKEWGGDELYKAYEIYGVRIPGLTGH